MLPAAYDGSPESSRAWRTQPDRSSDATEGVIRKQLLQSAVPVLLSAFFQQAYAIGDALVVGRFGTEDPLGGIQATTGLADLALEFAMDIGAGATIICGQFFGSVDHGRLRDSVPTGIAFSLPPGLALHPHPSRQRAGRAYVLPSRALYYGICCAAQLISGAIRSSGGSLRPMPINLSGTCGLRLLWLLLFAPAHRTTDFAPLCYPLARIAAAIGIGLYCRFGHRLAHGEDHRAGALA